MAGFFRAFGKIYGINTLGVKNCHLYEFEPAPESKIFPWRVWQYDLNDDGMIERNIASVYHEGDAIEIAS